MYFHLQEEIRSVKAECATLKIMLSELQDKNTTTNDVLHESEERYRKEKELWDNLKLSMETEIEMLRENEKTVKIKISEYEKHLEIISKSPDEIQKTLAENVMRYASFKGNR